MSKDMQVASSDAVEAVPSAARSHGPSGEGAAEPGGSGEPGESTAGAIPELDPVENRAWRSFLVAHARVARRLEMDLMTVSDLPLAEFDVLMQLDLTEDHRLRMNELADRVVLSRAGITRLVDRLVGDGLVARAKCDSDARGSYAVLTEKGHARLDKARPDHFAAVRRYFLAAFTKPEMESLAGLLEREFPT
jgi:DNA-binding MarR family transcriptional regulator